MEQKRLEQARLLIKKFREGTLSSAEEELLYRWFHQYRAVDSPGEFDEELLTLEKEIGEEFEVHLLHSRKRTFTRTRYWIAACFTLAVLGTALYFFVQPGQDTGKIARYDHDPGGNKAILTLENGKHIALGEGQEQNLAELSGHNIRQSPDSGLVYQRQTENPGRDEPDDRAASQNTLRTPRGGEYRLTLPDGTLVWLNSDTRITYPVSFGSTREVTVAGEAYFDVKHDKQRPFKVHIGEQIVEVLGTEFNVNAYPGEKETRTVLVSGSVKIRSATSPDEVKIVLRPGYFAQIYTGQPNSVVSSKANVAKAIAWRNGDFYFDGETLPEIMEALSRWYNVDVIYKADLAARRTFGGVISRHRNLSAVLQMLESAGKIKFKITEKEVIVMD